MNHGLRLVYISIYVTYILLVITIYAVSYIVSCCVGLFGPRFIVRYDRLGLPRYRITLVTTPLAIRYRVLGLYSVFKERNRLDCFDFRRY